MFRKAWTDIEALPFPAVDATQVLLDMPDNKKSPKNKWVFYGFIIGIIMTSYTYLSLIPGIPRETLMPLAGYDLIPIASTILPYAFLTLFWIPDAIGFSLLIPQRFLESFLIFFIALFVFPIPTISYFLGYFPSPAPTNQVTALRDGIACLGWGPGMPMGLEHIAFGSFIVLIAIEVVRHRSSILRSLGNTEEAATGLFSYKVNLIGFVVCLILAISMAVAMTADVPVLLLLMILNMVWTLAVVRIEADTSGFGGAPIYQQMPHTPIQEMEVQQ
jgi:hypothetical protein